MTATEIDEEAVARRCRRHGLEIEAVERDGTVLLLHPSSDSSLPTADRLAEIAESVEIDDVRYVTLALDDYGETTPGDGDE